MDNGHVRSERIMASVGGGQRSAYKSRSRTSARATRRVVCPDRVLFAKNSDRDPNEAQPLDWCQRDRPAPGTRVQCTWSAIEQVSETNAVLLNRQTRNRRAGIPLGSG
jgi:hypothetical protein